MSLKNLISLSTAGGGKTTRLIARVGEILKVNLDESRVLILSFTNSSCRDIFHRCGIKAETLHSFCYRFLPTKFTIEENFSRFTNIFLGSFFLLSQLGELAVNRLLSAYFIFKRFPEQELPLLEKDLELNREFQELVQLIEIEKKNHSCLFFSDIIHEFQSQLDDFLIKISTQYDHILIDEAQDLSETQLKILARIIESVFLDKNKTVFLVGDVKQSIYGFQGSSPKVYLKFIEDLTTACQQKNIEINFEKSETTYRFGGEILEKINKHFTKHHSQKTEGQYVQIMLNDSSEIETAVSALIEKELENYYPESIMVLFERNNKIVENLQNKFSGLGLNIKVYTQNNSLIDSFRDIIGFLQTGSNYFVARLLQGPFFFLAEPHFFLLNQSINEDLKLYNPEFFQQLQALRMYPDLLIKFLIARKPRLSSINARLLSILYNMSFRFSSLDSMILNIPETIKIQENGLQFSTVHSAKGLEADVVILLPQNSKKEDISVNLNPFFFFKDNVNDFTKFIIDENFKDTIQGRNNLYYVALTRAKKILYEVSFGEFF